MEDEHYTTIEGMKIRYQTRGTGPSALLLIHGAVGSCNDFALQLDQKFGLSGDEFTIVAYDLPGFGKSEPGGDSTTLKCDPTMDYFELCARIGAQLMGQLKQRTYSIAGWNDGARIASLLAIRNQSRVNALVLWGFLPIMDKRSAYAIARTRDIGTWNPAIRDYYLQVYGESLFSELWRKYVDFVIKSLDSPEQLFDIRAQLHQIKCPTLILHGSEDPIVDFEAHVRPLEQLIYDSDLVTFKGLAHNIHQAQASQFNTIVSSFVTSVRA